MVILTVVNGFMENDMVKAHTLLPAGTTTPAPGRTTKGMVKVSGSIPGAPDMKV